MHTESCCHALSGTLVISHSSAKADPENDSARFNKTNRIEFGQTKPFRQEGNPPAILQLLTGFPASPNGSRKETLSSAVFSITTTYGETSTEQPRVQ